MTRKSTSIDELKVRRLLDPQLRDLQLGASVKSVSSGGQLSLRGSTLKPIPRLETAKLYWGAYIDGIIIQQS